MSLQSVARPDTVQAPDCADQLATIKYHLWYMYLSRYTMPPTPPKLSVVFYRLPSGAEPVREWLKGLPIEDRRVIGQDLMRVQFGWPVGMPLCRAMGHGLWEVRSTLPSARIARVFFCAHDGLLVALHAIVKKTQTTPTADLALARQRMKDLEP